MSLWLTHEELVTLTGKKQRKKQIEVLAKMRPVVKFRVRPHDSFPFVDRAQDLETPRRAWEAMNATAPAQRVYVIVAGDTVKVGRAEYPEARLRVLRSANPNIERLAYASEASYRASRIEADAHITLGQFRVHGEWFRCSEFVAIQAVHDAERTAAP